MTEDFVIKYFWSAVGYGLMSVPVFFPVARHAVAPKGSSDKSYSDVASRTESESFLLSAANNRLRVEQASAAFVG